MKHRTTRIMAAALAMVFATTVPVAAALDQSLDGMAQSSTYDTPAPTPD